MRRIESIIIHCAATPGDVTAKTIDEWHRARGFREIGYHFHIRRNGWIENGRDIEKPGAHARGYNSRSIGICLAGGVDQDGRPTPNYTAAQWESLGKLVAELFATYDCPAVMGHNQLSDKACPCFDVPAWWCRYTRQNMDDEARYYGYL